MAFSSNYNLEYSQNDVALTQANAVIMPQGTTSYTVGSEHTVIIVRKTGNTIRFTSGRGDFGASKTLAVQPGDAVWDVNGVYTAIKYSTGGNSFVNIVNTIPSFDDGESDSANIFTWNGLLSVL